MDATPTSSQPARAAGSQTEGAEHRLGLLALCALALIVGVATGFGAVVLRDLIGLVHNAFYNGTFSYHYDANLLEPPSRFGAFVALSPILGGLVVVFLVLRFAPEAKGHGVPEVMDSVFYKRGDIRWQVAIIKSLASALSIGSGAAVGREGPIIQIGAAIGSTFGRMIRLSTWQKITLLAAGAGAGIAATFNTPLGGVLFALEILLPEVSNRTFLPVVVATGAATTIGRWLIGPDPAFAVPEFQFTLAQAIQGDAAIAFVLLGVLCGVAAWAFIRLLVVMEDGFPKLPGGPYVQNLVGMAAIGLAMVALTRLFGHSYIDGVGYSVIQSILSGGMEAIGLMALLFGLKLLATTVSLGCGASGGIFSPSLYLGATLGGGFAALAHLAFPHIGMTIPSAAIVGMAAMVGAATGGVMTAIVMIFEMTRDYAIIVPVIVAVAIAAGVRRALINETIYTIKLRVSGRRGGNADRRGGRRRDRRRLAADRGRARGPRRRPGAAALGPLGRRAASAGDADRPLRRAAHGRLPRRRSVEPGVRPPPPAPRQRGDRLFRKRPAAHARHRRNHHQARDRRHGDRQLRGLRGRGGLLVAPMRRRPGLSIAN